AEDRAQDPNGGRLPGAVGAEQAEDGAGRNGEVDAVEGGDIAEPLDEAGGDDGGGLHTPSIGQMSGRSESLLPGKMSGFRAICPVSRLQNDDRILRSEAVVDVLVGSRVVDPAVTIDEVAVPVGLPLGEGDGRAEAPVLPLRHRRGAVRPRVELPAQADLLAAA